MTTRDRLVDSRFWTVLIWATAVAYYGTLLLFLAAVLVFFFAGIYVVVAE